MPSSILNSDDGVISGTSGLKSVGGDDGVLVFQSKGTETARINTDKQIVAAAGTASLPVITTTGDTNTGIFFPAADTIAFAEGGAEAMRIDSDGDVGIGDSAPSHKLTVSGTQNTVGSEIRVRAVGVESGYLGANSNGFNIGVDNYAIIFKTNVTGTGSVGATGSERMRIDSSGNLLVGTTSADPSGTDAVQIQPVGGETRFSRSSTGGQTQIRFLNPNGLVGQISTSGSSTSFTTSSDYRLKHDIQPMTGALAKVAQLKPVTYKWNADDSQSQGFIAHELQEVVPECVTGEKDAVDADGNPQYQGIDTSFLVATLTAAIQELSAKNDALEARIAALEQA